jgi:predicted nucleic acid-binding protein
VVRRGLIGTLRAREALDDYSALPLVRHDHAAFLARAFDLATLSAYDAIYVALAERLDAALLTTDLRLARAVAASRGLRVALA